MLSRTADHLFWMSRYMERAENEVSPKHGRARSACGVFGLKGVI
ncbi:alpha-E domain-containing protein [Limnohabitans lacus]|jgi:A predicted alpha-helical domain with a conserved ER motif.